MVNINNKLKLLCVIIITIISVYVGFEYILPLFIPFVFAYFVAWLLLPIVRFLNSRLKVPKFIAGILSLGLLGTFMTWALFNLLNLFLGQVIALLSNIPIYLTILTGYIDTLCSGCDKLFGIKMGTMRGFFDSNVDGMLDTVSTKVMPLITSQSLNIVIRIVGLVGILLIIMISILLLIKDNDQYNNSFRNSVFYSDIHIVTSKLSDMGIAYLRTQAIMMIIISSLCSIGLLLIKNKYALLVGIGIGIFDAFPILGSGIILVPWGIISLLGKDIYSAAVLLTVYLLCQLVRQFLEPKLLGNRIGLKPVYTLMSMYIGLQLFGFAGFILGPLGLVIIMAVIKESEERLKIKSVQDYGA